MTYIEQNVLGSNDPFTGSNQLRSQNSEPGGRRVNEARETKLSEKVILVSGVTGAGKSTFIKTVTGNSSVEVGHGLQSSTQAIATYDGMIEGQQYRFLDTPGFNDTNRSEMDILLCITSWLCDLYCANIQISGIIYIHRISDDRIQGSGLRNIRLLEALCGDSCMPNLILLTTYWDKVPADLGAERESELCSGFWDKMIQKGAQTARFDRSTAGARRIVASLKNRRPVILAIQRQMIDEGRVLAETDAGRVVNEELIRIQNKAEMELRLLQENLQLDIQNRAQIQEEMAEYTRSLEKALQEARTNQQILLTQSQRNRSEWEARYANLSRELENQKQKNTFWGFMGKLVDIGAHLVGPLAAGGRR